MSTIEEMIRTPWVHWTLAVAYAGTILSIVGIIGKPQSGEVARVGDRAADVSDRGDSALCVFRPQHQEHAHDIAAQPPAVA